MKILVTGGAGFIGSAFLGALPININAISIDHGRNYRYLRRKFGVNISLIKGDVMDMRLLSRDQAKLDVIYHLSGVSGERLCLASPERAVISNVLATQNIIYKAGKTAAKRIIFSSSHWVYQTYCKQPASVKEAGRLQTTDSFYGNLKIASEEAIKNSLFDYVILRLSNVYGFGSGFGAQWRGLIGNYILNILEGNPIIIYGDGSQRIDLIHINDVIDVLKYFANTTGDIRETFNVASGSSTAVIDIAECLQQTAKRFFNLKVKIKKAQAPDKKTWPDKVLCISKLKKHTGFSPKVGLSEGILDFMQKTYEVKKNDSSLYKAMLQQKRY